MSLWARKLRITLINTLRERNLSKWLVIWKLIKNRGSDSRHYLGLLSDVLAHYPETFFTDRLVTRCSSFAQECSVQSDSDTCVSLSYCVLIKPYICEAEKGVLVVSFENQLQEILDHGKLEYLNKRYHILFIPSWTGLFSPALFILASQPNVDVVFVSPVHARESKYLAKLGEHCVSLPFNAASWVNEGLYQGEETRDIDCLMVANFGSFKRHWLLFKALQGLPTEITAYCVGVPLGKRTAESLKQEAALFGVQNRVVIIENPDQSELRRYFRRAKVFCAMSFREGSFIAVSEALMSGTPVVMFHNAHIGTKSLVNSKTGVLVRSTSELRDKILEFKNFSDHKAVREFASSEVSASVNCEKLNNILKEWSLANGRSWTEDIEPFYSQRLDFHYFNEQGRKRLAADYEELSKFGIRFPNFS